MTEPPLVIPFLPDAHVGDSIPTNPVRVAAWTASANRRIALAGEDNTLWIVDSPGAKQSAPPTLAVPIPGPSRRSPSGKMRPRAVSSASSISCSSRAGRRMFSPTASSTTLTSEPAVSVVAAAPEPPDVHMHIRSPSGAMLETLKASSEDRGGLGLGLAFPRRGLNVHSKEDLETSPKDTTSAASLSSDGGPRNRTLSRLGFWRNNDDEASRRAQMDEIAVEREMAREEAEDVKESEDFDAVQKRTISSARPANVFPTSSSLSEEEEDAESPKSAAPVRIVLPDPGRGRIVQLAVFEEIGVLVALRDVGLMDTLSLTTLALVNHVDLDTATTSKDRKLLSPAWLWRRVHLAAREEGSLLVANGIPWPCVGPSPNGEVTRVVMLSVPSHDCVATLDLPGVGDLGIASYSETSYLLHGTATSLMSYHIIFPPSHPPTGTTTPQPPTLSVQTHGAPSPVSSLLHSRRPPRSPSSGLTKFLPRRTASRHVEEAAEAPQPGVDGGVECPRNGGGHWHSIRLHDNGQGIGIGDGHLEAFSFDGTQLTLHGSVPVSGTVNDLTFTSGWQDICVVTESETLLLAREGRLRPSAQTWSVAKTYSAQAASVSLGTLYAALADAVVNVDLGSLVSHTIAKFQPPVAGEHICPLDADVIFAADERGNVRRQTLAGYLSHAKADTPPIGADRLDSPVTCSAVVPSELAVGGQFLVMGDEDGTVRIWDARSLSLRGSWTLFDDAVRSATLLDPSEADTLRDSVLFTSFRGSVAVISLRLMEELLLLPAARAPLTRIFVGGKDIMLAYENGKARVWNVETREFRRSTGFDSAEDMLSSGHWSEVPFGAPTVATSPVSRATGAAPLGSDVGRLLQLDLRNLGQWRHTQNSDGAIDALRGLLSVFLTFGINPAIDEMCTATLGIVPLASPAAIGFQGPNRAVQLCVSSPTSAWRVSPTVTGLRQLAIVTLLRPFLDVPALESCAADVIAYYTACLPDDALEANLELFAGYYLDSASDVHQAARMLFAARLSRMSNESIEQLVADHRGHLPSEVAPERRMSEEAARALTMVGGIALHRFECMNPASLNAVAQSISLYLHDTSSTHLALAIELCSKGFSTWQAYIDAMNLLRRLFYLAMHKDASGANTAAIARLAVLHVASSNAPLFMSTLSVDILDAKTVEGRTSIMKLCVFMARKRPTLLENGLPRICEAVVKSLDPNAGKMRDDVWEAATVILNELVQAFTTIDFHTATQKLAVGTHEGAVIMYDLKTASRLYVLEAHTAPVSAVAFAPDGRRLVTVSLVESNVTVWKIGSSLSGFFNVGGPPRQGSKAGDPYRRIPFVRPNRDPHEDTGALSDALILWRGNRQALVTINETALNFETT